MLTATHFSRKKRAFAQLTAHGDTPSGIPVRGTALGRIRHVGDLPLTSNSPLTPEEWASLTPSPAPIDEAPHAVPTIDPDPLLSPRTRRTPRGRSTPKPRARRPRTNKATWVYRYFDADDVLLYIGITDNLENRLDDHARSSSWMDFAVRSTLDRHERRAEAEEAEIAAIRAERPLFNLAHNDEPGAERRLVDYLIEHDRRDLLRASVSRG